MSGTVEIQEVLQAITSNVIMEKLYVNVKQCVNTIMIANPLTSRPVGTVALVIAPSQMENAQMTATRNIQFTNATVVTNDCIIFH